MELTPFAFLAAVERALVALLPTELPGGARWNFQRIVNFAGQSGSLEIGVMPAGGAISRGLGVLQVRVTPDSAEPLIQGWMQIGEGAAPTAFALEETNGPRAEEAIFALADGWTPALTLAATEATTEKSPSEKPAATKSVSAKPKAAKSKA
jgi:hypothetical protein